MSEEIRINIFPPRTIPHYMIIVGLVLFLLFVLLYFILDIALSSVSFLLILAIFLVVVGAIAQAILDKRL